MLPILLTILKIAGLVILALLGLVTAVLLIVLLVPVRYRLSGSFHEAVQAKGKITWLLHALSVTVTYEDGLDIDVRILGKRLFSGSGEEDLEEADPWDDGGADGSWDGSGLTDEMFGGDDWNDDGYVLGELGEDGQTGNLLREAENGVPEQEADKQATVRDRTGNGFQGPDENPVGERAGSRTAGKAEGEVRKSGQRTKQKKTECRTEKRTESESIRKNPNVRQRKSRKAGSKGIRSEFDSMADSGTGGIPGGWTEEPEEDAGAGGGGKFRRAAGSLGEKWNRLTGYKEQFTAFVTDQDNQKTIKLIFRQIKRILRHLLPTKVSGKAVLGFDDPAVTGKVLEALSILYAWYGDKIEIVPVFDRKILEVEGSLKGRIRFGTLLALGVRVLLNKNFRRLLKRFLRSGGR